MLATNKKASHNYTILRKLEAGIMLCGSEVKSICNHDVSISESFARIVNSEIFLFAMHVNPYKFNGYAPIDPVRTRKLLLNKVEIRKLEQDLKIKPHTTIIPLSLYKNEKGKIKVEIALVEGKREFDKRQSLKKKEDRREMREHKQ